MATTHSVHCSFISDCCSKGEAAGGRHEGCCSKRREELWCGRVEGMAIESLKCTSSVHGSWH